jgi:hypothetical protein
MIRFARAVVAVGVAAATSVAVADSAEAATYYNIVNYNSGQCLSVAGGANVIQWSDNGGAEQLWTFHGAVIEA